MSRNASNLYVDCGLTSPGPSPELGWGLEAVDESDSFGSVRVGRCRRRLIDSAQQPRDVELLSPPQRRVDVRLQLSPSDSDCDSSFPNTTSGPLVAETPPHRRMRSLRLNDTPHTPKSLLEKAQRRRSVRPVATVLFDASPSVSFSSPAGSTCSGHRSLVSLDPSGPQANVNPFTACRKRRRHETEGSVNDELQMNENTDDEPSSSKRLALSEINTSRYMEEFHQVSVLGDGEFGSVYECVNRLDGCTYAVKKSKMPVAGSVYERNALNEVYAHAVLGKHTHVVRYYSAWAEANHMYIQSEYCNGGSLADLIGQQRLQSSLFNAADLACILLHVAQGLKYIHAQGLVHLDIKPANVFIHRELVDRDSADAAAEADSCDEDEFDVSILRQKVVYKIGDLGHVTSVSSPVVEEGDCRYLPLEILHEEFDDLPKADVFSLALTIYEAGTLLELPKNGEQWHGLREQQLPQVSQLSTEFNELLNLMSNVDPKVRPTAALLTQHRAVCAFRRKSYTQLYKELNQEKLKNQLLSRELVEFQKSEQRPTTSVRRLLGRTCNRSTSLTVF